LPREPFLCNSIHFKFFGPPGGRPLQKSNAITFWSLLGSFAERADSMFLFDKTGRVSGKGLS
jgi:hypothetical protein